MKYSNLLFPNFLTKCLTLSYDDGVKPDVKLADIMLKYGLKGTFNLNSAQFGKSEADFRLTKTQAKKLYSNSNFEVAVHGAEHLDLTMASNEQALLDLLLDKQALEKTFNTIMVGMAYAYGTYNDRVVELVKNCNIKYARTVNSTFNFNLPQNFLTWHPTAHHNNENLMQLLNEFLSDEKSNVFCFNEPKLFYLWGHSYEFDDDNNWAVIEEFAKQAGNRSDVWYATNKQIYNYLTSFERLEYSCDKKIIHNPTDTDIYLNFNGQKVIVPKNKTIKIK